MSGFEFSYYFGNEADTYSFYRIPKTLFCDPAFAGVSCEAKVLYGLMLDRMSLSVKNGWTDSENRVFIYFTLEDAMESLGCGHDKGVKLMAELDAARGIGLIERVKQGLGKPCKIYVKNFIRTTEVQTSENPKSGAPDSGSQACENAEVQTSENPKSALPKSRALDFGFAEGNKTENNKTELSDTEPSIYPAAAPPVHADDRMDQIQTYRELLAENIAYAVLCERYGSERTEAVLDLLTETVCSTRKRIRIGGEDMPAEAVRSRLLKLDSSHVEYVFECMDANTTKIQNIRAYLLTALYRAPTTMEPYYRAEVKHDLSGGIDPLQ
jgi:hypothetical protein